MNFSSAPGRRQGPASPAGQLAAVPQFDSLIGPLNMSERTLRRKLREENTSFRNLVDQLRMEMAIKYLRDTDLTVEAISESVGFSDAANFRQAFRRWTKAAPHAFRDISGKTVMSTCSPEGLAGLHRQFGRIQPFPGSNYRVLLIANLNLQQEAQHGRTHRSVL
jgi:AraC-like DNA-binding protein